MRKVYVSVGVFVVSFVFLQIWARTAKSPNSLGIVAGELAACPDSPNCVSSQATESARQVQPLSFTGDASSAFERLRDALAQMPRATLVTATDDYLHAEFRTALLGFVDDVECVVDRPTKRIHIRSASRLGRSDFGANRKRVEAIRAALANSMSNEY